MTSMNAARMFVISNVLFALAPIFAAVPILAAILMPQWSGLLWIGLTGGGWLIAGFAVRSRAEVAAMIEHDLAGRHPDDYQ